MLHTTANPVESTQSTVLADYCSRRGLLLSYSCVLAHINTPQAPEVYTHNELFMY